MLRAESQEGAPFPRRRPLPRRSPTPTKAASETATPRPKPSSPGRDDDVDVNDDKTTSTTSKGGNLQDRTKHETLMPKTTKHQHHLQGWKYPSRKIRNRILDKSQQRYPRRTATSFDEPYSKAKLQGCARLPKYGSYIY
jgi:hypothetical protein